MSSNVVDASIKRSWCCVEHALERKLPPVYHAVYKALRSAGGFRRPLRSQTRENIEGSAKRAESTI